MAERRSGIEIRRAFVIGHTPSRSWAPGRVCEEETCRTVLSIYNPAARCFIHATFVQLRGGPAKAGRKRKDAA